MNEIITKQLMKSCIDCGLIKTLSEFSKDRSTKDGLNSKCRECTYKREQRYAKADPEKYKETRRKACRKYYYTKNGNSINQRPEVKKRKRDWYLKNRDKVLKRTSAWSKEYNRKPEVKERARILVAEKRKKDPRMNLNGRMSNAVRRFLKNGKQNKSWQTLVGYSLDILKQHLESQFINGMTWELFLKGDIHIDHIIPVSFFKFSSYDDPLFRKCWALNNLRPLWEADNIRKSDFLPDGRRVSEL